MKTTLYYIYQWWN